MTGKNLVKLIETKGWSDAELWLSKDGILYPLIDIEALFPKLSNTNDIVLTDGKEVTKDVAFWNQFYGEYMNIITPEEADIKVKEGKPCFYILYCDGTEGQIDQNISMEEWEAIKKWDVMFGYEK